VIGGRVKASRYVGFLAMVVGILVVAGGAVLPLRLDRGDPGVGLRFRMDGCGPAIYAAVHHSESDCQRVARRRVAGTTTVGLLLAAVGLVMYAGGDSRRSRVEVAHRGVGHGGPAPG